MPKRTNNRQPTTSNKFPITPPPDASGVGHNPDQATNDPEHIQARINALLIQYQYANPETKKFIENRIKALQIQLDYATI